MVRYLSQYKGNNHIFAVSESDVFTDSLLKQGLSVGVFFDNCLKFFPEETVVYISEAEREKMRVFSEGDVLEIDGRGIIYRWYSSVEGDAGIATTSLCNSNCIMCPAGDNERKNSGEISFDRLSKVIKHMPKDLWYFTVTGGEPTLVGEDKFTQIMSLIKEEFPITKILLLTNGRTLGDIEFFNSFIKVKPNWLRVAIPIHGSNAELHDYITQSPGGFNQTLRGIANLLKAKVEVELRIVISKLNYKDIDNIAHFITKTFPSVKIVNFIGLEMRGNCAVNADKVLISYQEAFEHSKKAIKYLINKGIDVGLYNFPYCMIDENFWPIAQKSISAYKSVLYGECNECEMKNECCGIFKATMDFYKPKVYPINNGENND